MTFTGFWDECTENGRRHGGKENTNSHDSMERFLFQWQLEERERSVAPVKSEASQGQPKSHSSFTSRSSATHWWKRTSWLSYLSSRLSALRRPQRLRTWSCLDLKVVCLSETLSIIWWFFSHASLSFFLPNTRLSEQILKLFHKSHDISRNRPFPPLKFSPIFLPHPNMAPYQSKITIFIFMTLRTRFP